MAVFNSNLFPDDKKQDLSKPKYRRSRAQYGTVSKSNVTWSYDFRPLIKYGAILLCIGVLAVAWHSRNRNQEIAEEPVAQIIPEERITASQDDEIIKRAEATLTRVNNHTPRQETTRTQRQHTQDVKVYTWVNESGQKIYSNKQRSEMEN